MLKRFVRWLALEHGRAVWLYLRLCRPDGLEYARYLKKHGGFYAVGENCSIPPWANVTDPAYTRLGNNVRLAGCTVMCHDGSINMFNRAFGLKLDRVGKVDLRDNVFVGEGAIILPNVTIGPNAVVAAGSVVTEDVPPDTIVGGIPARPIGRVSELVARLERETKALPWYDLIAQRVDERDRTTEPLLVERRTKHFYRS